MSSRRRNQANLDPSTEIMIAEHERLSGLYLYNSELGEKRTTMYVSVISLGAAGLVALAQFVEASFLLWPAMGLFAGILLLGLLTFHRLIERRIRSAENLRAINRIHRYFVEKDPELLKFFYWPPCDNIPAFRGKGAAFTGLRDVIALLNSIFAGVIIWGIFSSFWPETALVISLAAGTLTTLVVWWLHQVYEARSLNRAEKWARENDVRFPYGECQEDYSHTSREL